MRDGTVKVVSALHRGLYAVTGGRVGKWLPGVAAPMLLLTTMGRRSGRPHTVPLLYLDQDDGWLVIASFGGRDYHPAWYLNLLADPRCEVQIDGERTPVVADTVPAERRAGLWPEVVAAYPGYAEYEAKTTREIPLVLLTPA